MEADSTLRPRFMVIGAQKSGTTALFEYLSAHPDVAPPTTKEINYFLCGTLHARGLEYYHSHFPAPDPGHPSRVTFEASPNYLTSAEAPGRIRDYDPRMKLLCLLRDPVPRAFSAWQMYRRWTKRNPDWFFEWIYECDREIGRDRYVRRGPCFGEDFEADMRFELEVLAQGRRTEMPILRHGDYREQLEGFLACFPREQLWIEDQGRFVRETRAVLGEVEEFVGLAPTDPADSDLEPVFVGSYRREVPEGAAELLRDHYAAANRELFALLGRELSWA
ncbi:MAG: hypothetical protein CMJ84_11870 [Planctomycetes bacterium]|nr:hypothetical protein [Planctomycetota bacterium]